MGSWKTMWDFVRGTLSGWYAIASISVFVVGFWSVQVQDLHPGWVVASLVMVLLVASYRLFVEQEVEVANLQAQVHSLRHGTYLKLVAPELPTHILRSNTLVMPDVYIVNRSQERSANIRFTLIADGLEIEADGYETQATGLGIDPRIPNPKHAEPGSNYEGYLAFDLPDTETDITPLVVEGVCLRVTDEQTGFTQIVELPTSSGGIELSEAAGLIGKKGLTS